jgi:TonB family protein
VAQVAQAAAPEPPWRVPPRDASSPGPGDTRASARPAQAAALVTAPTTRAPRNKGRATPTASAHLPETTALRHDSVEPLAAVPLANANGSAIVAPPVVAPPAPDAVVPTAALEVTKVDVRPGIVKRVDARTSKLASGSPEMVVLRVLVSAAGSPATIQVLRGSKSDPSSDGAAVAAVKQWAFSPALKRGRPVDCWFNVAVPVDGSAQ